MRFSKEHPIHHLRDVRMPGHRQVLKKLAHQAARISKLIDKHTALMKAAGHAEEIDKQRGIVSILTMDLAAIQIAADLVQRELSNAETRDDDSTSGEQSQCQLVRLGG